MRTMDQATPKKMMRMRVIHKQFGVIQSLPEEFNEFKLKEWIQTLEEIADGSNECLSILDDKGNYVVVNPHILKEAVLMVAMD